MTHLDFDLGAGVFWPPPLADEVQPEINKKQVFILLMIHSSLVNFLAQVYNKNKNECDFVPEVIVSSDYLNYLDL